MRDQNELLAIVFDGEEQAQTVLDALQRLHHEGVIDLHNAAIIKRDAAGKTSIHEQNDFTTREGTLGGAALGGLIGLLRGKLLGDTLIGAGVGYLASKAMDLGFSDAFLDEIAASLAPNTSALVLAVEFERLDAALQALDQFHGKVIQQTLPADQARKLAAVLEN